MQNAKCHGLAALFAGATQRTCHGPGLRAPPVRCCAVLLPPCPPPPACSQGLRQGAAGAVGRLPRRRAAHEGPGQGALWRAAQRAQDAQGLLIPAPRRAAPPSACSTRTTDLQLLLCAGSDSIECFLAAAATVAYCVCSGFAAWPGWCNRQHASRLRTPCLAHAHSSLPPAGVALYPYALNHASPPPAKPGSILGACSPAHIWRWRASVDGPYRWTAVWLCSMQDKAFFMGQKQRP